MKRHPFIVLSIILSVACCARADAPPLDLEKLYKAPVFALGGVGYGGETTESEVIFQAILNRSDNLEVFLKVYVNGNNQAQMYAMTAFYYLDRNLYEHIKGNYSQQKIVVEHMVGCIRSTDSLQAVFSEFIEKGYYDQNIPVAVRQRAQSPTQAEQ